VAASHPERNVLNAAKAWARSLNRQQRRRLPYKLRNLLKAIEILEELEAQEREKLKQDVQKAKKRVRKGELPPYLRVVEGGKK
jgi:D-ribose pyranose/furanose isomerase RbsD